MTGSKEIITEMRPNLDHITVSYGDKSKSEVLGLGKVVVAHNISLVDVMLVETLGYNLLSVRALSKKRTNNGKEVLGYVPKTKKKKSKNAQAKTNTTKKNTMREN